MSDRPPAFYDSLPETLSQVWQFMNEGASSRQSGFHHMTLSTWGMNQHPRGRTVILRGCEPAGWRLRCHTDSRSDKVKELQADPRVSVHFYDPVSKIQIRMEGTASLHKEDAVAHAAWASTRLLGRQCYGISPGPGTTLLSPSEAILPDLTEEATQPGRENFCAIVIQAHRIEWLFLALKGHRRAQFTRSDLQETACWLSP